MTTTHVCSACQKGIVDLENHATRFGKKTILCDSCYEKITKLTQSAFYCNMENLIENWNDVNHELLELNFPKDVFEDINIYFEQQREALLNQEHDSIEIAKFETVLNDYSVGKYREAIKAHLVTTGYNFEGYAIEEYLDIVSGESVLGTGFLSAITVDSADYFSTESNMFAKKLNQAKKAAQDRAILKSICLGGNAIIGIQVEHLNFDNDMIGVTFTGTSVKIKKH